MNELVALFDSTIRNVFAAHPRPTAESVSRINRHLDIVLPEDFVMLASESASYSSMFAGIGPDFESANHLIYINKYWRRRRPRIPTTLVILTRGFDDMFWCLDTSVDSKQYPVQFWCPTPLIYPSAERPVQRYEDFSCYLKAEISVARM